MEGCSQNGAQFGTSPRHQNSGSMRSQFVTGLAQASVTECNCLRSQFEAPSRVGADT